GHTDYVRPDPESARSESDPAPLPRRKSPRTIVGMMTDLEGLREDTAENRKLVSVVVPVFRNAESLRQLYTELVGVASSFSARDLEIVFVDDGSDDDSWEVITSLRAADPERVSAHRLSRNFGQLSAMVAGYRLARGDAVVSISADLQDPTELIGEMVARWL